MWKLIHLEWFNQVLLQSRSHLRLGVAAHLGLHAHIGLSRVEPHGGAPHQLAGWCHHWLPWTYKVGRWVRPHASCVVAALHDRGGLVAIDQVGLWRLNGSKLHLCLVFQHAGLGIECTLHLLHPELLNQWSVSWLAVVLVVLESRWALL